MASLFLRKGVWYGRHVYRVNGRRREKKMSFATADEHVARKRFNRWAAELEAGKWNEPRRILLEEAAKRFQIERRATLKPSALKRYVVSLKKLKPLYDREIGALTRTDVAGWIARRRKDPGRGGIGRVTDGAIRVDLACLSAILGFCIEREWIEANVVTAFLKGEGKRTVKRGEPRTRYLSIEEERRLILAALNGPQHNASDRQLLADAIAFAIDTGLRLREQFDLAWEDIDLGPKPRLRLHGVKTKSGKSRTVYLTPRALDVVSRRPIHNRSRVVFWARQGKAITDLDRGLKSAAKRAKIADIQWHDLRRTCGCRLLQDRGASIHEVSRWLGHSSIVVTERHYAFLKDEDLSELANDRVGTSGGDRGTTPLAIGSLPDRGRVYRERIELRARARSEADGRAEGDGGSEPASGKLALRRT